LATSNYNSSNRQSGASVRVPLDIALLKEYGFKKRTIGSPELNLKKIEKFGMRQLDRLKMLLFRNESLVGGFPERLEAGIQSNDPESFAKALALLSKALAEEWDLETRKN
jgi:hypothetical protein